MKSPFDSVTEIFSEYLEKLNANQKSNFDRSDKFMLWIVGFSIGGVSLIVTNIAQFNKAFTHGTIKSILILLSVSIISGIVYRWFFYLYQIQYQNVEFYLQGAFTDKEMMEIDPDDLTNETDIKEVVRRLKADYDEDVSFIIEDYNKITDEGKFFLLKDLIKHYKRVGEQVKKEYEFAMNYSICVFKDAFGLSDKQVEKIKKPRTSKNMRLYSKITAIAFFISCSSFVSVITILCVKY
jgi:hypothetical protein